ncbi:MAG: glycoside hydrolase family 5 protein [Treponema sp.]|jgi:endoglucanase|nr:glycoside hydrolase family 5 protein [Treponema sp.]
MYRIFLLMFLVLVFLACPTGISELPLDPGMSAVELVKDMGLAVNIGNTLDSLNLTGVTAETAWGNPSIGLPYIRYLKSLGYNTIRLPVSWADYIDPDNYFIDGPRIRRVETVVNWILQEGMYCILNTHHDASPNIGDKSWIEKAALSPQQEMQVKAKFAALWRQITLRFLNASEKLVFEGMNEPQFDNIWNRFSNVGDKTNAYRLLNELNQLFVDTVRTYSLGSKYQNNRYLLVSGYWTDIDLTMDPLFKMPTDTMDDRLIISVHYYTPWDFAGGNTNTWGTGPNHTVLNNQFNKLKTHFIDKGIPVILGEYSVNLDNFNNQGVSTGPKDSASRREWLLAVTQKCLDLGICPVLWETGMRANNRGMADIRRTTPFTISADLRNVLDRLVWPQDD